MIALWLAVTVFACPFHAAPTQVTSDVLDREWLTEAYQIVLDEHFFVHGEPGPHLWVRKIKWMAKLRVRASFTEIRNPQSDALETAITLTMHVDGTVDGVVVQAVGAPITKQLVAFQKATPSAPPLAALNRVEVRSERLSSESLPDLTTLAAEFEGLPWPSFPAASRDSARAAVYDICSLAAANRQCLTWREVVGEPTTRTTAETAYSAEWPPNPVVLWAQHVLTTVANRVPKSSERP